MPRSMCVALAAVMSLPTCAWAAEGPAGVWRLALPNDSPSVVLLLSFTQTNGQWAGQILGGTSDPPAGATVAGMRVAGDRLQFTLQLGGDEIPFDGKLPAAAGQRVPGSVLLAGQLTPAALEPSRLKAFDRLELFKEIAEQPQTAAAVDAVVEVLHLLGAKPAPVEEARTWAARANKAAEPWGIRWQQAIALRLAQALGDYPTYLPLAVDQARHADKLLDPADEALVQLTVLDVLTRLLRQAGRSEEESAVLARIPALEQRDREEYQRKLPVKPEPFPGRRGPSDRTVLVELFCGADDPLSVAGMLAADALGPTYRRGEVVCLQYHLHIPGPDPLAVPAALTRQKYYGAAAQGTPALLLNGKSGTTAAGEGRAAPLVYRRLRGILDPLVELPPLTRLSLTATRTGETVRVTTRVAGLSRPNERLRLRLALVEDGVRYRGGNGVRYHHSVVRDMFGTEPGLPLRLSAVEHTVEANLPALRKSLTTYLDKVEKDAGGNVFAQRPLAFTTLRVVAFVQDDATQEIWQAGQAAVK